MLNKLILFLIRRKLHLKKYQYFYFKNQANKLDRYYFYDDCIVKISPYELVRSNLSLNFLLSNECKNLIMKE